MKKKAVLVAVVLIVCFGLLISVSYMLNEIFPKAKPIKLPDSVEAVSVSVAVNTDDAIAIDEACAAEVLLYISDAKPTRRQSVNDYPDVRPFYRLEIHSSERDYRCFVYEEGSQVFIELPYEGIYTADSELLQLLSTYFNKR